MKKVVLILVAIIAMSFGSVENTTFETSIPGGGCENPYNSSEFTYAIAGAGPGGGNQFYHVIGGNTYEISAFDNALLCWAWDQ